MKECSTCKRCFPDEINHCPDDGEVTYYSIAGEPVLDSRYQLERRLGQGGMGVVFQARHIFLKTAHAIKVILPDLVGNDPMLVTRFRQEALAAAAIRHQNIIAVTDFGVVRGVMPFLVMEFVKGCSLQDILAQEGRLSPARALEIMSAVGAGVSAAHRQNIVHRDLKPLNIMLQDNVPVAEGVKVLDFGLAKIKSGELLGSFVQAKTSGLMGSPFYMAPEQWSDEEPDVRADIYSLGVILYQMLAGDVPFRGSSIPSIMKKHLTSPVPPFTSFDLHFPKAIEDVVQHALAKDADQRTPSVDQFVNELREAVLGPSVVVAQSPHYGQREQFLPSPQSGPISSPKVHDTNVHVRTFPGKSRVFVNNVAIGVTNEDGLLVVPNMLRGQHQVFVMHDGYTDWFGVHDFPGGDYFIEVSLKPRDEQFQDVGRTSGTISASSLNDSAYPIDLDAFDQKRRDQQEKERSGQQLASPGQSGDLYKGYSTPHSESPQSGSNPQWHDPRSLTGKGLGISQRFDPPVQTGSLPVSGSFASETVRGDEPRQQSSGLPSPYVSGPQDTQTAPQSGTGMLGNPQYTMPMIAANSAPNMGGPPLYSTIAPPQSKSSLPKYIAVVVVVLVLVLAAGGFYFIKLARGGAGGSRHRVTDKQVDKKAITPVIPDLVSIPGGTFMMGRDKGPPQDGPAHSVKVAPFMMDRTEVTNSEYAQFIAETNYKAPPSWGNNEPPAGQERWPVTSVSVDDARAFAVWRSKRDGVEYRLPTEEEWEFAARSGSSTDIYPWGSKWDEKYANLETKVVKPVGSYLDGQNKWGVVDLIGNVWEWTSSKIVIYPGNKNTTVPPEQRDWTVIRGGSWSSDATKDKAVSAVTRQWVEPVRKDALLGFRLVRPSV